MPRINTKYFKTHFDNFQSVASGIPAGLQESGRVSGRMQSGTAAVALQKITLCTYAFNENNYKNIKLSFKEIKHKISPIHESFSVPAKISH